MTQLKNFAFPSSAIPADIGSRIRAEREALGWTQQELADHAKTSRETVSRHESYEEQDGVYVKGQKPNSASVLAYLDAMVRAGADIDLQDIVRDWPEATPGKPFGYGPLSRLRREELGLTLEKVAAEAKVHPATLSRFERNATPSSTLYEMVVGHRGEVKPELDSLELARALGFATVEEHRRWCIARE